MLWNVHKNSPKPQQTLAGRCSLRTSAHEATGITADRCPLLVPHLERPHSGTDEYMDRDVYDICVFECFERHLLADMAVSGEFRGSLSAFITLISHVS